MPHVTDIHTKVWISLLNMFCSVSSDIHLILWGSSPTSYVHMFRVWKSVTYSHLTDLWIVLNVNFIVIMKTLNLSFFYFLFHNKLARPFIVYYQHLILWSSNTYNSRLYQHGFYLTTIKHKIYWKYIEIHWTQQFITLFVEFGFKGPLIIIYYPYYI